MMETLSLDGRRIPCRRVSRSVRCPRLEFCGRVLTLVLPHGYDGQEELLRRHRRWILRHADRVECIAKKARRLPLPHPRDPGVFRGDAFAATKDVACRMGVQVTRITFRRMRTRWGSCRVLQRGRSGRITVNTALAAVPDRLLRYVVTHEVAHILVRRHGKRFRAILNRAFPDTDRLEEELSLYGYRLLNPDPDERPTESADVLTGR